MSLVIDSSATLAWIYSKEAMAAIEDLFARLAERGAWFPACGSSRLLTFWIGPGGGRHDAVLRGATLADLAPLPVNVDPEQTPSLGRDGPPGRTSPADPL